MRYRLKGNFSIDPDMALEEILRNRGVDDIQNFMYPTYECELDPHRLEHIDAAVERLLYHLRRNSAILFVVDADADGFTSSAVLWLYIKHIFPNANLELTIALLLHF